MQIPSIRLLVLTLSSAFVPCLQNAVTAQVPTGTAVFGTFSGPASTGMCGLFEVPLSGGQATPITGLPAVLQAAGGNSWRQGVGSVVYRATDGALVVGTIASATAPAAGAISLFVLYLNGSAVDSSRTVQIQLGTALGGSVGGARVFLMPDDRILVSASQPSGPLVGGAMAGNLIAIVDTSTQPPTFTFPPTPAPTSSVGGAAVDVTGNVIYYGDTVNIGLPTRVSDLYRWDLTTNQACSIGSWPGEVLCGICCEDDGSLYVSSNDANLITHKVHHVQPNGCNLASYSTVLGTLPIAALNSDIDRATGTMIVSTASFGPGFSPSYFNSLATFDLNSGATNLFAAPPVAGWGNMAGVTIHNAIRSYGSPSDGANRYWFENLPNPGGQPILGSNFSLEIHSSGAPMASGIGLSLNRAFLPMLGIDVLIDFGNAVLVALPATLPATYNLPLPSNAALHGLEVFAQSVHLEPGNVLAASRGLSITVQ
jgi:hypothetical protein